MSDRRLKLASIRILSKIVLKRASKCFWVWATIARIKKNYIVPAVKKMILTITSDGSPQVSRKPSLSSSMRVPCNNNSPSMVKKNTIPNRHSPKGDQKPLAPATRGYKGHSVKSRTPTKKLNPEPLAIVSATSPNLSFQSLFPRSLTPNT